MSDKKALIIFSEIVQSLEEIRDIAKDLVKQGESKEGVIISDEEIALQQMSGAPIHQLKSADYYINEEEAGRTLLRGCQEIEEKTVEMIQLCLEFTHPL
ncbi:MAG: hypothetical protein LUP95_05060 [Euryarchaeota archaeon]|nr:hypothetical protein [Euryarchaeota archaeon]